MNDILLNLIIDGNYILSKSVFVLHKNNLLYGNLHRALENTIANYRKWYPFSNIYLVSDSKEKSWRKKFNTEYKSQRKKNSDIDWQFVYTAYDEFKQSVKGVKILETPHIEGDDWISFLVNKSNQDKKSNIIVSNDYDIKQVVSYSLDPLYVNIMTNEMLNKEKIFLPKNYQLFLDSVNRLPNNDIFALNDNEEFLKLFGNFTNKYQIIEVDPIESLMIKVISGDQSDNIMSVWKQKTGDKVRGIGEKGAISIYNQYLSEFGEVKLSDPDLFENMADLICEKKKLSKTTISDIVSNIQFNMKLIDLRLDKLPIEVVSKMEAVYANI